MASEVSICNSALQLVKHSKQISSLTDGTSAANACELIYEEKRDVLLDMHNWNFATKRVKLARLSSTPGFEWDYEYQKPADFIRAVSIHQNSDGRDYLEYKIEGGKILTNAQDVYLRYIARVVDPNMMPPSFREALTFLIASYLAVSLGQSRSLSQALKDDFTSEVLPVAKSIDSLQDRPDRLPESVWVTSRNGGFHWYEPGEPDA